MSAVAEPVRGCCGMGRMAAYWCSVQDPKEVTIENLDIGNAGTQKNEIDILQTGSGASIAHAL